jgi:hypothetical protein
MKVEYPQNVNVNLNKKDIGKIFNGETLSEHVRGYSSGKVICVNLYSSNERFYSLGGLGEGFDNSFFNGWTLEPPRETTQLTFPWGEEEHFVEYGVLDIRISQPALEEYIKNKKIRDSGGFVYGVARGIGSGHVIDRLNLKIDLNS